MIEIDYEDGRINLNRDSSEDTSIIARTKDSIILTEDTCSATTVISEPDLRGLMATEIDDSVYIPTPRTEYKFCFQDPDHPEVAIECTEIELQRRVARDMEAERLFIQWFPNSTTGYDRDCIHNIPRMIAEDIVGSLVATYLIKWWNVDLTSSALDVYLEIAMKLYKDFKIHPNIIQKKLVKSDLKDPEDSQKILDVFGKKLRHTIERG